jgi:hypothetical protein
MLVEMCNDRPASQSARYFHDQAGSAVLPNASVVHDQEPRPGWFSFVFSLSLLLPVDRDFTYATPTRKLKVTLTSPLNTRASDREENIQRHLAKRRRDETSVTLLLMLWMTRTAVTKIIELMNLNPLLPIECHALHDLCAACAHVKTSLVLLWHAGPRPGVMLLNGFRVLWQLIWEQVQKQISWIW